MKFDNFDFIMNTQHYYLLPSLEIIKYNKFLTTENMAIKIDWLCFHCKWRFIRKRS